MGPNSLFGIVNVSGKSQCRLALQTEGTGMSWGSSRHLVDASDELRVAAT